MSAKVQWYREAWWVITHAKGKKRKKRLGPTQSDKQRAENVAEKINAALVLGQSLDSDKQEEKPKPLPTGEALLRWHKTYSPTFKPSFEIEARRMIANHLVPFFGDKDLRA